MTANMIFDDALKLLGYTDSNGNSELTQRLRNRAIVTFNLVYEDLWHICNKGAFIPIKSLSEKVDLPQRALGDVILYGLAMHIARNENDGDQQQFFAQLYNARRSSFTRYEMVKNILPRGVSV